VIELVFMREELDTLESLAVGIDVDAKTIRAEAIYPRPEKKTLAISELNQRGIDLIEGLSKSNFKSKRVNVLSGVFVEVSY
jgi:hypothetical protein